MERSIVHVEVHRPTYDVRSILGLFSLPQSLLVGLFVLGLRLGQFILQKSETIYSLLLEIRTSNATPRVYYQCNHDLHKFLPKYFIRN